MEELSPFEAARILGCPPQRVRELLGGRAATQDVVEELAMTEYPWRRHVDDECSYWVTVSEAAEILEVSIQRVKQYLDNEQVPFVRHSTGLGSCAASN